MKETKERRQNLATSLIGIKLIYFFDFTAAASAGKQAL